MADEINIESKEDFKFICTICNGNGNIVEAVLYCIDCSGYCCQVCTDTHSTFPVLMGHKLLDANQGDQQLVEKGSNQPPTTPKCSTEGCNIHEGNVIDMFCKEHYEVGCCTCISERHKSCPENSICSIPHIIDSSFNLEDCKRILGRQKDLISSMTAPEKTKDAQVKAMQDLKNVETDKVLKLQKTLEVCIRRAADTLRNKIERKYVELENEILQEIQEVEGKELENEILQGVQEVDGQNMEKEILEGKQEIEGNELEKETLHGKQNVEGKELEKENLQGKQEVEGKESEIEILQGKQEVDGKESEIEILQGKQEVDGKESEKEILQGKQEVDGKESEKEILQGKQEVDGKESEKEILQGKQEVDGKESEKEILQGKQEVDGKESEKEILQGKQEVDGKESEKEILQGKQEVDGKESEKEILQGKQEVEGKESEKEILQGKQDVEGKESEKEILQGKQEVDGKELEKVILEGKQEVEGNVSEKEIIQGKSEVDGKELEKEIIQGKSEVDGKELEKEILQGKQEVEGNETSQMSKQKVKNNDDKKMTFSFSNKEWMDYLRSIHNFDWDKEDDSTSYKKRTELYTIRNRNSINIKLPDDSETCNSFGCCLTFDNDLLVTDIANKKLKLINTRTKSIIDHCLQQYEPLAVCCVNKYEAVVSSFNGKVIQFVSLKDKMKPTRQIKTSHYSRGIATNNDKIYVSNFSSLYVYDMAGNLLKTIKLDKFDNGYALICHNIAFTSTGDKMYLAAWQTGILCFDAELNYLSTLDILRFVEDVCVDNRGNVFAVVNINNNVLQINEEGKCIGPVVPHHMELMSPTSACFHRAKNRLFVSYNNSDEVNMFELR